MPVGLPKGGFKDETEFNKWLRARIRGSGYSCLHVREADIPGPLDLIVWKHSTLIAWIELKLDNREVRESQKEFAREQAILGGPRCLLVRYRHDVELFEVGPLEGPAAFTTSGWGHIIDYLV